MTLMRHRMSAANCSQPPGICPTTPGKGRRSANGQERTEGLTVCWTGDVVLNTGPRECHLSIRRAPAVALESCSPHIRRLADTADTFPYDSCRPNCS